MKTNATLFLISVLSVSINSSVFAASIETEGSIGVTDLRQMIAKVRNFHPKDQFDKAPTFPALAGRRFDLALPLKIPGQNNKICTGDAFWAYSSEEQTLRILYGSGESGSSGFLTAENVLHPRSRFTFRCSKTNKTKLMQNSFGAVTKVDAEGQNYDAIEAENMDAGITYKQFDIKMAGSTAREVTKSLQLRVRGTFSTNTNGQPINCDENLSEATLSMPSETFRKFCTISAHVSMVQLTDGNGGRVLATLFDEQSAKSSTNGTEHPSP